MRLKFLFINTYPQDAIDFVYSRNKGLAEREYQKQKDVLSKELPDIASSYSLALNKLGYKSDYLIANNEFLQNTWAKDNNIKVSGVSLPKLGRRSRYLRSFLSKFPRFYYFAKGISPTYRILFSQIKSYQPEILYILDPNSFGPNFLKKVRRYTKKIIGHISCPTNWKDDHFRSYNFLVSSYPHYVERFKKMGIPSGYIKHAFDRNILGTIVPQKKKYNCVFVGGLSQQRKMVYPERWKILEEIIPKVDIVLFGLTQNLPSSSLIKKKYRGRAWGKYMYEILAQSKIVVNKHISQVSQNYANNLRMYETTGVGTLLITDMKDNLRELFEIGKEVVIYQTVDELVEKIKYYLQHNEEREKIAKAGQERTLKDHTYEVRAKELVNILQNYL